LVRAKHSTLRFAPGQHDMITCCPSPRFALRRSSGFRSSRLRQGYGGQAVRFHSKKTGDRAPRGSHLERSAEESTQLT
jgi:hypothetical protein